MFNDAQPGPEPNFGAWDNDVYNYNLKILQVTPTQSRGIRKYDNLDLAKICLFTFEFR